MAITVASAVFTAASSLESTVTFSSLVFLLVSLAVAAANARLPVCTHSSLVIVGISMVAILSAIVLLLAHLWAHQRDTVGELAALFLSIAVGEVLFARLRRRGSSIVDVDIPPQSSMGACRPSRDRRRLDRPWDRGRPLRPLFVEPQSSVAGHS